MSLLASAARPRAASPGASPLSACSLLGLSLLLAAGAAPAAAQEAARGVQGPPAAEGPELERVFVPERAFTRVLARHPGGVMLRAAELDALLARARAKAQSGVVDEAPADAPRLAAIARLVLSGRVVDQVAELEARAELSLSGPGPFALPLPLAGIGLTGVWVDEAPARVIVSEAGPTLLLERGAQVVRWRFAAAVLPPSQGAQEGAGRLSLAIPAAASAKLDLALGHRVEPLPSGAGVTLWGEDEGAGTRLRGACSGQRGAARTLELAWRPRESSAAATPFVTADDSALYTCRRGVTTLQAQLSLHVYRGPRQRFTLGLPAGFVVRELTSPGGDAPSYFQRGDQVELRWATPRQGALSVTLEAERPSDPSARASAEDLSLRPLRALDVDRSEGLLAIAAGPETILRFGAASEGLERGDLSALPLARRPASGLVRVYHHSGGQGRLSLERRPLEPRVSLGVQAALQVRAREVRALVVYRFSVQAGQVFAVRALIPAGYSLEGTQVLDDRQRVPAFRAGERPLPAGERELLLELEEGLSAGRELLVTLECVRELPLAAAQAQGARSIAIPRFGGEPASELRGVLGFAPDPAFRLAGTKLAGLLPIPAAELPRAGLDVEGLVLGYRIEARDYRGQVEVQRRETRVSVEQIAHLRVSERLLTSEVALDLEVTGAPLSHLDLWLPEGVGALSTIRGPGLSSERERVEARGGRERWRLDFAEPWAGRRRLELSFQTRLEEREGALEAALPKVAVHEAFRARGTLAVFSEGDAELSVTPSGLRPLEVTEVPDFTPERAIARAASSRPLFAFRWVRPEHDLALSIRRPGEAPVLSAVAQHLELSTSADRDGRARHSASFRLTNLDNQFFGLLLPEGAELWSVVVNGEGVKPASQDGVHVIPIPNGGRGAAAETRIVATYTLAGGDWGSWGSASLVSPQLLFGTSRTDAVPVLRTTWRLALPEDLRILELSGNLEAPAVAGTAPALVQGWQAYPGKGGLSLALGAGALLLLILSLARARRGLLGGLERLDAAGRGVGQGVAQIPGRQWLKLLGVLALLGVVGLGLSILGSPAGARRKSSFLAESAAPRAPKADLAREGRAAKTSDGEDFKAAGAEAPMSEEEDEEKGEGEVRLRRSGTRVPPGPPAESALPSADAQEKPQAKRPRLRPGRRAAKETGDTLEAKRKAERFDDAEADEADEPAKPVVVREAELESSTGLPKGTDLSKFKEKDMLFAATEPTGGADAGAMSHIDPPSLQLDPSAGKDLPASGAGGEGRGAAGRDRWGKGREQAGSKLEAAALSDKLGLGTLQADAKPAYRFNQEAEGWQVGLRSLVLDLRSVGQGQILTRAGGEARLELSFVREGVLLGAAALLAFLTFLAGALLPRLLGLSALSLICGGLLTLTVCASLASEAAPLLNAATLGLLGAIPLLVLGALSRTWASGPAARLGRALQEVRRERHGGAQAPGGVLPTLLLLGALCLAGAPAGAQEPDAEPKRDSLGKVFVPFDSDDPRATRGEGEPGRVFLPREVYEELMRRAFPERAEAAPARPPVPALVQRVDYEGRLSEAGLSLRARVVVEVLQEGWVQVPLGLLGSGLQASEVRPEGGAKGLGEPRVRVAQAGGYELLAQGPARYALTLDLVVPRRSSGYAFATVPAYAAQLVVRTPDATQRLHVAGARAQQPSEVEGEQAVLASLGDARQVVVSLRSREVLSAGASDASAETRSLVWVRRGRIQLTSVTSFRIVGAGREGFVFELPTGFQVTEVQTPAIRSWRVEGNQLRISLLRAQAGQAEVTIKGEQPLADDATRFEAPQITAQGVSRERGSLGVAADAGLRIRPGKSERFTQIAASELSALAAPSGLDRSIGWAYGFARRPCSLILERVAEEVEVHAETTIRASLRPDRYSIDATIRYDVRRGRLYEVRLLAPAGFTLVSNEGLKVREVDETPGEELGFGKESVVYSFGLESALEGQPQTHRVRFVRRLSFDASAEVPFPDLRPLGVSRESSKTAISTTASLQLKPATQPADLTLEDVARLTRGWPAAEAGGTYQLGYTRSKGRAPGLASASCTLTRPQPYQTGSWVLHARVERDVVRYTLRALYEIERAGVSQFGIELPSALAEQVSVSAENRREVRVLPTEREGRSILVVELQSPAEVFYDFALTWEQVLSEEASFALPTFALRGVDRALRGFVLVEKAPEVADLLAEAARSGVIQPARAADAPALPPGKGAEDFALVYQVPLTRDEEWALSCKLEARAVTLPAPAQVLWGHLESVFTRQGQVRHRIRYRIRNLRLQFLAVELPPKAEVWSVFVAGEPRRLHHRDGQTLIPLPKRSAADLSFDVELIYATPPGGELGAGGLAVAGPKLVTERVEVQKTYWSVYLPADFRYSGFEGNLTATSQADAEVERLRREVSELARLDELARTSLGRKQEVADGNLAKQRDRIAEQLQVLGGFGRLEGKTASGESIQGEVSKNQAAYQELRQRIQSRQGKRPSGPEPDRSKLVVEGNAFSRGESGWNLNDSYYKGKSRRWSGVAGDEQQNEAPEEEVNNPYHQQKEQTPQPQRSYTVKVGKGNFSLQNARVVQRDGNRETTLIDTLQGQEDREERSEGGSGDDSRRGRGEGGDGLLSIKVEFATPGRAQHFVLDDANTPQLRFSSAPQDTGALALRIGQGLSLLLLLGALLRLGLHRPAPDAGRTAAQALLLLGAAALAAASLYHPGGLALCVLTSLLALRKGRLWPALAPAPGASQ